MTLPVLPVASPLNSQRIADQILEDLQGRILRGELPNGARLPTERDIAAHYGVSGPTVREAIRGLSARGLIKVRHGSGAYVTADPASLVAQSLGTVIQLEKLGIADILSTSGCMTVHAARLAAQVATAQDKAELRTCLTQLDTLPSAAAAAAALHAFHEAIMAAAHNPLMRVLSSFLTDLIVALSIDMMEGNLTAWRRILNKMRPLRTALVDAIVNGEVEQSAQLAEEYVTAASALVVSVPRAREVRLQDPQCQALLQRLISSLGARRA